MENNNDMIITRLAELVSASPQKSKETLKQVQGDELLVVQGDELLVVQGDGHTVGAGLVPALNDGQPQGGQPQGLPLQTPSLRAFEKCVANYCLSEPQITQITQIKFHRHCGLLNRHSAQFHCHTAQSNCLPALDAVSPDIVQRSFKETPHQVRGDGKNNPANLRNLRNLWFRQENNPAKITVQKKISKIICLT